MPASIGLADLIRTMELQLDIPIRCPILVGRSSHLAWLERCLDRAQQGAGQIVRVAGEAGIGKSRLIEEVKGRARHEQMLILEGYCFEPDDALPYAPFLDLLRTYLARLTPDEVPRRLGPTASELAAILPDFAGVLPPSAAAPPADPAHDKRRLFHALAGCVSHLAAIQPVFLVIEDLHWSDETSLELLGYLARRLATDPVLIVVSYRSDDVDASLGRALADLDRQRLAAEVRLGPLTKTDEAAMLDAILGGSRPISAALLDVVYPLTEGNPYFVEEVVRSLLADGVVLNDRLALAAGDLAIPHTVQDAVRRSSGRLSAGARRTLELAAVVGRRVDFSLLLAISDCDEQELLGRIKELIAAQLLVEESADRFAFRHALARQAIYDGLLARERRDLHRTIADALETAHAAAPDAYLEDLARHFGAAEAWAEAAAYSSRAGARALALYAPGTAVDHFTRAIVAAGHLGRSPSSADVRARGQAFETLGNLERARADYEAALELARAAADAANEWEALIALGLLWSGRDYGPAGGYFGQAFEVARALGDPATLARSYNRCGNWHSNAEQPRESEQYHHEALSIFTELNDRLGIAETLDFLGMAAYLAGSRRESVANYERTVSVCRELDDRRTLVSSLATLAIMPGNYIADTAGVAVALSRDAEAAGTQALDIAIEIGWRAGECYVYWELANALGYQGRYGRAEEFVDHALRIASEIEHTQWLTAAHMVAGALHHDLLSLDSAREYLERALSLAQGLGSVYWIRDVSGFLGSTLVAQREFAAAERVLDAARGSDGRLEALGQRRAWMARAELALGRGRPDEASAIGERLFATARHKDERGPECVPYLANLLGRAYAAAGRATEAETWLRGACAGALAHGARSVLWRGHVALGNLYREERRRDEAQREYAAASAIVVELAAEIGTETLRADFLRGARAALPHARPQTPRQAAKAAFGGLTEREREVATLIAEGRSNREIAAALFVGERTVASHVHNILAKLEFTSRAQIARWMTERESADPA